MSLAGKRIALTGKLRRFTRPEAARRLAQLGADVSGSVSASTDLVIAAVAAGTALETLRARGVPIVDERGLERLLDGEALSAVLAASGGPCAAAAVAPDPAADLAADPIETALRLSTRLAAARDPHDAAAAPLQTIYLLRAVDDCPTDAGLNRIGGLPPGIPEERWPRHDGAAMTHLFTLDVASMRGLRRRFADIRTISLFVARPHRNEAHSPDNDWSAVHLVAAKDARRGELPPPEDVDLRDLAWFEPVAIEIPADLLDPSARPDGDLRRLRRAIDAAPARVLGPPRWIEAPEHPGDLLMQFDARFVDVDLGDAGTMYLFEDTAFWQCH
jgi:BRCA1-like protein